MTDFKEYQINLWVTKIRDLVDSHDLSIAVYQGSKTVCTTDMTKQSSYVSTKPIVLCSSARADHVEQLKALGIVTGWFSMEQRDSKYETLWEYELVIL